MGGERYSVTIAPAKVTTEAAVLKKGPRATQG